MEFTAIAPNPTAACCNACLRVKNLFMASFLDESYRNLVIPLYAPLRSRLRSPRVRKRPVTIQEAVCPKHCLDEQAEALLRIGFRCNGSLRNFLFFLGRRPIVGHI